MSGAGNNIPQVPTFTPAAPSITDLNNLAYAVQFLVQQDVRPTFNFFSTATTAIGANVWAGVTLNKVAFDCDGVAYLGGAAAQIVTQGRYAFEACISVEAGSTGDEFVGAFLFQAGPNNPNFSVNTQVHFGHRGSNMSVTGSAAADNAMCLSDIAPMVLYPGDFIDVNVFLSAAHTVDYNQNTSYIQGRFVTKFTGYLVAAQSALSMVLDEAGNVITDEPGGGLW